jgi:hypothetical protein
MIGKPYPFLDQNYNERTDVLFYVFLSQGATLIPKAIAYTPLEKHGEKYYNWGFGDLVIDESTGQYSEVNDKIESNNGDFKTVFYTVVSTLPEFFKIHPSATVHIEGSNAQRADVYRRLIVRHWQQIEPFYEIRGYENGQIKPFDRHSDFEYILISRKEIVNL